MIDKVFLAHDNKPHPSFDSSYISSESELNPGVPLPDEGPVSKDVPRDGAGPGYTRVFPDGGEVSQVQGRRPCYKTIHDTQGGEFLGVQDENYDILFTY